MNIYIPGSRQMKTVTALVFLLLVSTGFPTSAQTCSPADRDTWLSASVQEIAAVKVGTTRENFLKVFTRASGFFTSTRLSGSYEYKGSPYIRVDVEFSPDPEEKDSNVESPKDTVRKISKPYLEQPVYD